jgi:IS30 family transposase
VLADRGPAGTSSVDGVAGADPKRRPGRDRAQAADAAAFGQALRPKAARLTVEPRLRAVVEAKLALRWSPQQIAGWLPLAYPQDR